ncbi:DUF4129 domain-containing protein [Mycolicibacterium sp. F2034L]|uniref:DUF4129 domain-containing protein n=1 Tax=Mycolicibacterium sp. F2034L TaxID=2926422 RepID=UPI001FF40367|nr:DUF4129 domain-containing protein [Mycolicibacterium sp. F2034L]MCK0176393.1 DUF4129 domain-containing protein [Mycolicibacterium sp. F2034L]
MATMDIDRDAARDAAQTELGKPIYPKDSWTERISAWLEDLLYRIAQESSTVPGGWLTVAVLVALLVVAIVVAARIATRTLRTRRTETTLFDRHELDAAGHRATAERHATAGEWAPAIRHRLRAVARGLEESGALQPVPGRTATELARDASTVAPQSTDALRDAAEIFNDVSYGGRPGSADEYRLVADLDDRLRRSSAVPAHTGAPGGDWAEVR